MLSAIFPGSVFSDELKVISVGNPEYTGERKNESNSIFFNACQTWRLNKKQVGQIFSLSTKHEDNSSIINDYYWLPCEIKGALLYNNVRWEFIINAAATARWKVGNRNIYWGCDKKSCDSMFLLPYDKKE